MSVKNTFQCHKISDGIAKGEVMYSTDDICFYLLDPKTGKVIEENHAVYGKSVAGKILVFPSGKGSSVVQADGLYQLQKHGNAPKAMIIEHADTVLVASAIIIGIPLVNKVEAEFYKTVQEGDQVTLDANNETITIV